MAVWSVVKSSNIEYTRIDGEYYQPKYINELNIWENLSKTTQIVRLKAVIDKPVRTGSTPSNRLFQINDEKVPFIKTNTLREGKIVFSEVEFLPKRIIRKSDYIEDLATIVTIIGATKEIVGRVAIKRESDPISTTNQNVGIINFNVLVNPYFGMIYLQSKYGRDQLWRHSRQTEQVNLNCREIERILFPLFDSSTQDDIGGMVKKSFDLQDKSISLYKEAEELLEKELGLDGLEFEKPRSYTAKLSEVYSHNRFDSEHFKPKYFQLKELIKNYTCGYESLTSHINYLKPNINPHSNPTQDYNYIELSGINASLGIVENSEKLKGRETPSRAKRVVQSGDLLVSSVVGSVEKVALVSDDEDGFLASTGFFHFQSDFYIPEYLLILMKSKIIKEQLFQESTGGILSAVPDSNLKNIIIPIVDESIRNEIALKVKKSHKALKQSKQLLEDSKAKVEALIEEATR